MKLARFARFAALVLTLLAIVVATRLKLSKDLTSLFPATPEAKMLARVTRAFGGGDVALVLLRGEDPGAVEASANATTEALAKVDAVAAVIAGPPSPRAVDATAAWRFAGPVARRRLAEALTEDGMRQRLRELRALLLAPGASEAAEWLARDPLRLTMIPWEGAIEMAAGARGLAGGAFVADGGKARLVVVEPRGRAFEAGEAARFTDATEAALAKVRAAHPTVRIDLTGGHVVARQTEAMVRRDLQLSGALSFVLAAVVFVATFRRPRALLALFPPLAVGTLWTTAVAALAYPRLSAVATAFAAVVVGVGVDTGVHVYGRLLRARREGASPERAADIALRETWKATLGAAFAAGGAFACLALSDVEGMRQLGILCGAGEVLTAVAILLAVPTIGARLERGDPPAPLRMDAVARLTATKPRATVVVGLAAVSVVVAVFASRPKIDHAVVALDGRTLPALATYDAIYAAFGGQRGQVFVVTADADEARARARADAIAETAETMNAGDDAGGAPIAGFDALGRIAPSVDVQKARLAERDRLDWPAKRALLEKVLREEGFAPEAFADALASFERPSTDVTDPLASDDPTIRWLRRRHLARDAEGVLVVTYIRFATDDARADVGRTALRAADPSAVVTGFADLERGLVQAMTRDLPRVFAAAFGLVLFVLAVTLRRPSRIVLAVVVLAVEIALVLLLARAFGVRWHVYDALVLPVLLGISLDEAMFLLDAASRASIEDALAEQAPLGTTTALTTAAGFGALVVCRFDGLVDVGKVGAIGSVVGLVVALAIIPAGLRLRST